MTPTPRARLLSGAGPGGEPRYLAADDGSRVGTVADEREAIQLRMGTELLGHARALLDDPTTHAGELRFLGNRLTEALRDTLRIAHRRGERTPLPTHQNSEVETAR